MIRLPASTIPWTLLRVCTAPSWNADSATDGATWIVEPSYGVGRSGYEVLDVERVALPQVGTATLRYRMGVIDGKLTGVLSSGATPAAWDPATMTAMAPSLIGKEIRIQQCLDPDQADSQREWVTVFWGQVEYEEDHGWPGSTLPSGERIYHLTDALARTRKWFFTKHTFNFVVKNGTVGYNTERGGIVVGNRGANTTMVNGQSVREHVLPGTGTKWNDREVLEHALTITRPSGQPLFAIPNTEAIEYLTQSSGVYAVSRTTSAFEVMSKAADWKHGRGVVALQWEEDVSTASEVQPLTVYLSCSPPFQSSFDFDASYLGGSTLSWPGANFTLTSITVDLIGDSRAVDGSLRLGDPEAFRVDYLESVGDPIETLVTLSVLDGSLAKRWTTADETALAALVATKRGGERWRPVGQRFGLPLTWNGAAADGNGGSLSNALVTTTDLGLVDDAVRVGPLSLRILPDLPILEGYVYTGSTPVKGDGSGTATEDSTPDRRAPLPMSRLASGVYLEANDRDVGLTLKIDGLDIWMYSHDRERDGSRYFADNASLSPSKASTAALITVAIASDSLPVRFATAANGRTEETAKSRKTIRHPGLCLWYASPGAIYELDHETPTTGGYPAKRAACRSSGGAGILRDDRLALCARHIMAARWYGLPTPTNGTGTMQAAESKRSASWQLRCGGLAGGFETVSETGESEGETAYPALGELVRYLYANGSKITLNTPITRIHYDHQQGITTWTTDWQELDFA